ncbi:MAG: undecaprenyl-diphosphate phosphatase [Candidatus Methanofastidiosia archaeon]
MFFYIFFGILQGILEWLPISSSGNLTLILMNFFGFSFKDVFSLSLYLHLGTMFSVTFKFRRDFFQFLKEVSRFQAGPKLKFLIFASLSSLIVGLPVYLLFDLEIPEKLASFLIAISLILTGIFLRNKKKGLKKIENAKPLEMLYVGAAQGISIIPGVSRSGITLTALLSRGFSAKEALHFSFLMSVPAVVGGILLTQKIYFEFEYLLSTGFAFLSSLIFMEVLLKLSDRYNFSIFCFLIAGVTILLVLVF